MKQLSFYENSRNILRHLENNEDEIAFAEAKKLLNIHPDEGVIWFIMGLYYQRKQDIFNAIDSFTRTLRYDPSFVSAAEMLLKLNKDNYSVSELKYLYMIITTYKAGSQEMHQFLRKFKNTPANAQLTVPNLGQDELSADNLPGIDDNEYIQHLIKNMDNPEQTQEEVASPVKKELSIIPEKDYHPPRSKAPEPVINNNTTTNKNNYGIETMTMAQLYIRQGLYEQALDILFKLQQRDPSSERVKGEIERVSILLKESKKES